MLFNIGSHLPFILKEWEPWTQVCPGGPHHGLPAIVPSASYVLDLREIVTQVMRWLVSLAECYVCQLNFVLLSAVFRQLADLFRQVGWFVVELFCFGKTRLQVSQNARHICLVWLLNENTRLIFSRPY